MSTDNTANPRASAFVRGVLKDFLTNEQTEIVVQIIESQLTISPVYLPRVDKSAPSVEDASLVPVARIKRYIKSLNDEELTELTAQPSSAIANTLLLGARQLKKEAADDADAPALTLNDEVAEEIFVESAEKGEVMVLGIAHIDILADAEAEALTTQGRINAGYLPKDFDVTDPKSSDEVAGILWVDAEKTSDGKEIILRCPISGSADTYTLDGKTWLCDKCPDCCGFRIKNQFLPH